MNTSFQSRRDVLSGLAVAAVTAAAASGAEPAAPGMAAPLTATSVAAVPAFRGQHAPKPLPFNPAQLTGLSEKLLVSHHDNNYTGAVKNLNRLEQELSQVTKDTPAFMVGGLRQSEMMFRNSMTLHEAYFGNLGGDGKPSGPALAALSTAYGSSEAWQLQFRATGASLGGGSGWVVLGYELLTGELRTVGMNHHTQSLAASLPLLVMDMYEHAYAMDYGAAAGKYIDAFFNNVHWDAVNQRLEQAQKLSKLLRA